MTTRIQAEAPLYRSSRLEGAGSIRASIPQEGPRELVEHLVEERACEKKFFNFAALSVEEQNRFLRSPPFALTPHEYGGHTTAYIVDDRLFVANEPPNELLPDGTRAGRALTWFSYGSVEEPRGTWRGLSAKQRFLDMMIEAPQPNIPALRRNAEYAESVCRQVHGLALTGVGYDGSSIWRLPNSASPREIRAAEMLLRERLGDKAKVVQLT